MAELQVVGGIAGFEGEAALLEQVHTLTDQLQECIDVVLGNRPAPPST
jgi:hypothetical protein